MFGRRLRALRPLVEPVQRTLSGRRAWVYTGIRLQAEEGEECRLAETDPTQSFKF